ncbi:ABC transporter permease [Porphyromonas gingivicanis]|uniref:ABC transporter permease n=1 Tax=Porphyromonas gingivicanis TaxID=266762 RepID=A0A0A2GCA8_9PORP|nr:ABC transporter permease [Porphyromonas gingivicanis]KGN98094.1 ABC transporter permease [Porphyromonas gingivicanis]
MSNSKIGIIIGREYAMRVRKKSFFILTILMPFIFIGAMFLPMLIGRYSVGKEKVMIIDHTGQYATLLENTENYTFLSGNKSTEEYKLLGEDNEEGITAVLEIKEDLLENPKGVELYGYRQIPSGLQAYIETIFSSYLTERNLEKNSSVPNIKEIVRDSQVSLSLSTYKWDKEGKEERSSGNIAGLMGLILSIISFFFISTYGASVMGLVLEEKKNRIMEVMVSSVRPFDMMMGKIVAMGLVGITQIVLWVVLTGILFAGGSLVMLGNVLDLSSISTMQQADITGMAANVSVEEFAFFQEGISAFMSLNFVHIGLMFLFYFIGGFLLYASIFAAVGSAISSEEDSNQFIMPVMLLLMVAFYTGIGSMNNPDGPLAFWCSLIPFTSPIVMMVRLPYGVPVWQQIVSVILLFFTFGGFTWLSAKIYRVGILMYGKKPSFRELARWITFK